MKKKKSANNLLPYSFLVKFAPSTTYFAVFKRDSDSALVKTVFFFAAVSVSVLINKSGCALKPAWLQNMLAAFQHLP